MRAFLPIEETPFHSKETPFSNGERRFLVFVPAAPTNEA